LLAILAEKIRDNRFLRLLGQLLKAGYLEDWRFNATYSGTPQGGVVTPPTIWQTSCWTSR
jgi:retron-type reverse transcriptase